MITYCKLKINVSQWGWGELEENPSTDKLDFQKFSKTFFFFSAKFCCKEMLVVTPH
jgi:hypothetical protein